MGEPRKKKKPNEATEKGYTESMSKNILGKEKEIRKNRDESLHIFTASGKPVISIQGKGASVRFKKQDIPENSILTHNHPRSLGKTGMNAIGNSFSPEDIASAINTNAKEIRAVTPTYTFSMKRPKGGWGVDAKTAVRVFNQESRRIYNEHAVHIIRVGSSGTKASVLHYHLVNRSVAQKLGWDYTKKKG